MTYKPFTTDPSHWNQNKHHAKTKPATITTDAGEPVPGVHIEQHGRWIVLTETNAVKLATSILDTIESTRN